MAKRDIVFTNVTVVQLLRQPCPGEGGSERPGGGERGAVGELLPRVRAPAGKRRTNSDDQELGGRRGVG